MTLASKFVNYWPDYYTGATQDVDYSMSEDGKHSTTGHSDVYRMEATHCQASARPSRPICQGIPLLLNDAPFEEKSKKWICNVKFLVLLVPVDDWRGRFITRRDLGHLI